jgi:pre-mRNA-processing factor 6
MEPASSRKAQVWNALRENDSDANLFLAIAKVFWYERKAEKIRKWIRNAVTVDKNNGDAWAHLLRYEVEFGTNESQKEVISEFEEAEPRHGDMWAREVKKVQNWRANKVDIIKKLAMNIKLFDEV